MRIPVSRFSAAGATAVACAGLFAAALCSAQTPENATGPHETRDPAVRPAAPRPLIVEPVPPARLSLGPDQSVQVNTAPGGGNIVGDAANEPSITFDPLRPYRMAIGWRQFDSINSSFREAGFAWSRDAGRTWTNGGVLQENSFRTDPVLDADANGTFYYQSLYGTSLTDCDIWRSTDGGRTWLPPVAAGGGDKNWMVVDRSGASSDGFVYGVWRADFSCCGPNIFNRSIDAGASYSWPVPISQNPAMATIAVHPSGDVFVGGVLLSNLSQFRVAKSLSAGDGGPAFGFETVVSVNLGGSLIFNRSNSPNPAGLCGQVWIASDVGLGPARGNLYLLCSVDPSGTDPCDVRFSRSTDGGLTWSPSIRVNDDASTTAWQWFGTMAVAPGGRIDVVWCDTRASGQIHVSELRYSSSSDAGATWTPSIAVSPTFNSYLGWPRQNKLGDYYQLVSDDVGASLAYAATFNGEQDIFFLRIGDYDCNGNGVGDAADISRAISRDVNGNGQPDECECIGDVDADLNVGLSDLGRLLAAFGSPAESPTYDAAADIDGNARVDVQDLAHVLAAFGRECE
ncbi:MAG: hypothetical protein AMXMBFR47_20110 [Planctomycetota bacterium]